MNKRIMQVSIACIYGGGSSNGRAVDCGSTGCEFKPRLSPLRGYTTGRMTTQILRFII